MFDAIKGAIGSYSGQKRIKSQLRVIKDHPQVSSAAGLILTTAGVVHVLAETMIFPVARAAVTIASEYIQENSTQDGIVDAAAYVCTVGIHGIVDVATRMQIAMQPDPNSVRVRGQRDQQCDTKIVEMYDHEMDQIDQRTTIEDFGKKPCSGVSDDGLEDVDLYQGATPNINVDTCDTAKCTLDPYDDWQLINSDDETDERIEEFQNEHLAESDGSLPYERQAESYKDSDTCQNMNSYNERLYKSGNRLFPTSNEHQFGRELQRRESTDSLVNSFRAKLPGLRSCNGATSGVAFLSDNPTTSDEELDPEIERLVMEMKWRHVESTCDGRGKSVRQIGDILNNTTFQPSITSMRADLNAAQLATENAKYEVFDKVMNNTPKDTRELKETLVRHIRTRPLEAPTESRRYIDSGSEVVLVPLEARSQPISIPGAIARKPASNHTSRRARKLTAMDDFSADEGEGSDKITAGSNTATKDDWHVTVFSFSASGMTFNASKIVTIVAGKTSSASRDACFEQAASETKAACHQGERQLCECGVKEEHSHVGDDEKGKFEV